MDRKELISTEVFNFFIESHDFNGIPLSSLSEKTNIDYNTTIDIVKELVSVNVLSIQATGNPHIIGLSHYDQNDQIQYLEKARENSVETLAMIGGNKITTESFLICIYPSTSYLIQKRNISEFIDCPYTKQLALGEPQLKPIFFEIEVLERYFKDPRYSFNFKDYSGQISCEYNENDEPLLESEDDQIFLQSFGLGLDDNKERVAVVYLRYLKGLTADHQLFWKSKEKTNDCIMVREYYENTIMGNWTSSYSIFTAFIEEQRILNELSIKITGKQLFNRTFEEEKRPKEFTFFLIPTLENYNSFVSLLDKMISENINKKFFKGEIDLFELIKLPDGLVERKKKRYFATIRRMVKTKL